MASPHQLLRSPWARRIGFLVMLGLAAYVVVIVSGGLGQAFHRLRHADLIWLIPAVAGEAMRHVIFGYHLRHLRGQEEVPSTRLGSLVSLITFGLGPILPAAPAEGMTMSVVELRRRGMGTRNAGLMLTLSQVAQFGALMSIFAIDWVVIVGAGELRHASPLWATVAGVVTILVVAVAAWGLSRRPVVGSVVRVARWLPFLRGKSREEVTAEVNEWHEAVGRIMGSGVNRARAIVLASLAMLCSGITFWCGLRSVDSHVSVEVAILAYAIAVAATWVPFLPSGFGLVEIAVPAMLHHFGVPTSAGLAAVLIWRAISFFLAAAGGVVAYLALRFTRPRVSGWIGPEPDDLLETELGSEPMAS